MLLFPVALIMSIRKMLTCEDDCDDWLEMELLLQQKAEVRIETIEKEQRQGLAKLIADDTNAGPRLENWEARL